MRAAKSIVLILTIVLLSPLYCRAEVRDSYPALPEALDALQSDNEVTVTIKDFRSDKENFHYYVFEPAQAAPAKGFIYYPGGKIDARAYAPPLRAIAAAGYLTVIVGMPDDLAMFGYARANRIIREYREIEKWAIGGHSMGGSFACKYAKQFTWKLDGIILWASWPSALFRLNRTNLKAISIYGTEDEFPEEIEGGAKDLPPDAGFVKIEGGNHGQFGYYDSSVDPDPEDNPALISREEQQRQIIEATVGFMDAL